MVAVAALAPVPVTADDPWYADLPVQYTCREGSIVHFIDHDYAAAMRTRRRWMSAGSALPPVTAEHRAPDGRGVIGPPWPGGTWSGECGSTCWITDVGGALRAAVRTLVALGGDRVALTPQWRTNFAAVSASQVRYLLGGGLMGGFRVECRQRFKHAGPCRVNDWAWDPTAGVRLR